MHISQIIANLFLSISICHCSLLVPEQFHCQSSLLFNRRTEDISVSYQLDEFVDRDNRRSSTKVRDDEAGNNIYYNQLFGPINGPIERRFIRYDVKNEICKPVDVNDWPLAEVRKLIIAILPSERLVPKNVDIAIGSGGLLHSVEGRWYDLRLKGERKNEARLAEAYVFEFVADRPDTRHYHKRKLLLQVEILKKKLLPSNYINKTLADVAKELNYELDIIVIRFCSIEEEQISKDKPTSCDYIDIDVEASIEIIEELKSSKCSLIGQRLEDDQYFDFDLNPFAQPTGIGCWDKEQSIKTNMILSVPANRQFSAEYHSVNGSKELSYVAYDDFRHILRLDRHERKSIYDLKQFRSYHMNEYHSTLPLKSSQIKPARNRYDCIELDIGDGMLDDPESTIDRLLGFDIENHGYFMGSKTIDGETFDVYENEVQYDKSIAMSYNLPIVMEPIGFVMPWTNIDYGKQRRYFITYYVQQIDQETKIPRYAQFWEYILPTAASDNKRSRSLINLVEFTRFSWSLDVEPENDSNWSKSNQLFSIDSCAQARSDQLMLTFNIMPNSRVKYAGLMDLDRRKVEEDFCQQVAGRLDIPRLNIIQSSLLSSGSMSDVWMLQYKIAELIQGIGNDKILGYIKLKDSIDWLTEATISQQHNRHSLDSCKLDSLSLNRNNVIVFCPGKTMCLFVEPEVVQQHKTDIKESEHPHMLRSNTDNEASCEIHQFSWTRTPAHGDRAIIPRVYENKYQLTSSQLSVKLTSTTSSGQSLDYTGLVYGIKMKLLDSIGSPDIESLTSLRFLSSGEEGPQATGDDNYRYKLNPNLDSFKQCQMSCQYDEFCESYSVCKRTIKSDRVKDTDCILSRMRLTQARVSAIGDAIRAQNKSKTKQTTSIKIEDTIVGSKKPEVVEFVIDPECSIHPKDFLSQFKISQMLTLARESETSGSQDSQVTLEECSGISSEMSLGRDSIEPEFVYCPIESLCITDPVVLEARKNPKDSSGKFRDEQTCYVYSKTHLRFYDYNLFTKLSIKLDGSYNKSLNTEEIKRQNIGQVIEGLSVEGCARDCNLRLSNCLAFDLCQLDKTTSLCILYSIRSPFSPRNTLSGLLPQEKRFYEKSSKDLAVIVENRDCGHFRLKDSYFNLKIDHMLNANDEIGTKLANIEDEILRRDSSVGDALLVMDMINAGSAKVKQEEELAAAEAAARASKSGHGLWINVSLMLMGIALGSVGYLYGADAYLITMDTIETFKARRNERHPVHRISQLNLPDNLEM